MQTHFSAPEKHQASDSSDQQDYGAQFSSLLEQVDSLLKAEQLVMRELIPLSQESISQTSAETVNSRKLIDLAKIFLSKGDEPSEDEL